MNISDQFKEVVVLCYQYGFISAAKKLTVISMQTIVALSIDSVSMPHETGQVGLSCLDKQVIMVVHQTKS